MKAQERDETDMVVPPVEELIIGYAGIPHPQLKNEMVYTKETVKDIAIAISKLHVEAALKSANKNVKIKLEVYSTKTNELLGGIHTSEPQYPPPNTTDSPFYVKTQVNQVTITNAYPLENIK